MADGSQAEAAVSCLETREVLRTLVLADGPPLSWTRVRDALEASVGPMEELCSVCTRGAMNSRDVEFSQLLGFVLFTEPRRIIVQDVRATSATPPWVQQLPEGTGPIVDVLGCLLGMLYRAEETGQYTSLSYREEPMFSPLALEARWRDVMVEYGRRGGGRVWLWRQLVDLVQKVPVVTLHQAVLELPRVVESGYFHMARRWYRRHQDLQQLWADGVGGVDVLVSQGRHHIVEQ